jgi:hypothetical protein
LTGALIPLAGTAPTNVNFVSGDYNRKTGLVGNGSTKYLNSNRANNADLQDSNHNAVYATVIAASNGTFIGAEGQSFLNTNFLAGGQSQVLFTRNRSVTGTSQAFNPLPGFLGHSRASSTNYTVRGNSSSNTVSVSSSVAESSTVFVYRRNNTGFELYGAHRLAFYSIGESLSPREVER